LKPVEVPHSCRVKCVARKRWPLADDLAKLYASKSSKLNPDVGSSVTVIGHTRFATSSKNIVSELHPHEFDSWKVEKVWEFNSATARFEKHERQVGLHLTHNGDFDALRAYDQVVVVDDVGLWLERLLHVRNDTRGDSPKVCGMMDLFRVQGRWAAAARLAWVRCVLSDVKDVSGGQPLSKSAPNTFPGASFWERWATFLDEVWMQHINNIIVVISTGLSIEYPQHKYSVNKDGVKGFVSCCLNLLNEGSHSASGLINEIFSQDLRRALILESVKGFLRADLYTALTELLSRAEGSFGLQVHSTIEKGVVVIASKGQPMSIAFNDLLPIVLFGSEAEAVAVPVTQSGDFLPLRLDLDSKGEIFRIGEPKLFDEGTFSSRQGFTPFKKAQLREVDISVMKAAEEGKLVDNRKWHRNKSVEPYLFLKSGIEIRSYSLISCSEVSQKDLFSRCVQIRGKATPYDPNVDLVLKDLNDTPRVMKMIDDVWTDESSHEYFSGKTFCDAVLSCMEHRLKNRLDIFDILISGVEASLWMAEQWAADLRRIFPLINIVTVSPNKLLGLGQHSAGKVFFPASESISEKRIDPEHTCVLLISQSGQTFPTLHATRLLALLAPGRIWVITGARDSKMEQTLLEYYTEHDMVWDDDRIILNMSGSRPAEPTSVAVAATWHTLTHMLFLLCTISAVDYPEHRGDALNMNSRSDNFTMNLTDGCLRDMNYMISKQANTLQDILGSTCDGEPIHSDTHRALVMQGKAWADHVNEYWYMLVSAGTYIICSVSLGIPIFSVIGHIIIWIMMRCGYEINGNLSFSLLSPASYLSQSSYVWPIISALLQLLDALFYVYIIKLFTWGSRYTNGRPLWARHGKRTIVIVDSPCVHQMLENFVSKLYSQAYSFCSVDVHGASGLDHFVHRFTHRVSRGLLLAVGRPDGRIQCLAKSESAILLAVKQAAFIRNPDYDGDFNSFEGAGPEIVTVSHNPFKPNMGLAHHITLKTVRRKFVDEYLFERLHTETKPKTKLLMLRLCSMYISSPSIVPFGSHHIRSSDYFDFFKTRASVSISDLCSATMVFQKNRKRRISTTAELENLAAQDKIILDNKSQNADNFVPGDPSMRVAFCSKLDEITSTALDRQMLVQQFYECRVASLERYLAFCVMFHAMASSSNAPILKWPWDIARSQSNLRVATTASPISAAGDHGVTVSRKTRKICRLLVTGLKGYNVNL